PPIFASPTRLQLYSVVATGNAMNDQLARMARGGFKHLRSMYARRPCIVGNRAAMAKMAMRVRLATTSGSGTMYMASGQQLARLKRDCHRLSCRFRHAPPACIRWRCSDYSREGARLWGQKARSWPPTTLMWGKQ